MVLLYSLETRTVNGWPFNDRKSEHVFFIDWWNSQETGKRISKFVFSLYIYIYIYIYIYECIKCMYIYRKYVCIYKMTNIAE